MCFASTKWYGNGPTAAGRWSRLAAASVVELVFALAVVLAVVAFAVVCAVVLVVVLVVVAVVEFAVACAAALVDTYGTVVAVAAVRLEVFGAAVAVVQWAMAYHWHRGDNMQVGVVARYWKANLNLIRDQKRFWGKEADIVAAGLLLADFV